LNKSLYKKSKLKHNLKQIYNLGTASGKNTINIKDLKKMVKK
jgi:hypothetical protein